MTTITAKSPNRADIQAAVDSAVTGDIIEVPAGTVDWTGQLFAPDGIWIRGAGRDATKLLKKDDLGDFKGMFTIDCKTGQPFKLSGIHLEGRLQDLQGDNRTTNQTEVRDQGIYIIGKPIDIQIFDCRLTRFTRAGIEFGTGNVKHTPTGVIYRNEFIDCWYSYLGYGVAINGGSAGAWDRPIVPGSADMLFIEDNLFDRCRHFTAAGDGAVYVARYNRCVDNYQDAAAFDMHGLSNAWPRGGRWIEVYCNTVDNSVKRNSGAGIRGGGGVLWGNSWVNTQCGVELMLENADEVPHTTYPHKDQIGFPVEHGQLYIWDNIGGVQELSVRESNPPNGIAYWLQENRDYHCKPMPGYVPFAYPHPLRTPVEAVEPPPDPAPTPDEGFTVTLGGVAYRLTGSATLVPVGQVKVCTPIDLGLIDAASVTSLALTTGADSALGNLLIAFGPGLTAATQVSSVTDTPGNTWTVLADKAAVNTSYGFKSNALAVASGGTITANFAGVAGPHGLFGASVSGISTAADPRDKVPSGVGGAAATSATTLNSGVLAQSNEILFGYIAFSGVPVGFTPGGNWILLKADDTNVPFRVCYQIVSNNASVAWGPSWASPPLTYKSRFLSVKGM